MKVSLNWLRHYVDFAWSPEELAERLTMLGLEVEGIDRRPGAFAGIVVGEVVTRDPHPNADKLSVCRVRDGQAERQIVCGAQNFKPGDKVPLILPGATLPPKPGDQEPFVIKVGKIRGVESHGMMCSGRELGLSEDHEGLLILPPDAVVGKAFGEHLGRPGADVVYDLEVTPNRPDLNSVIGIAREIAAVTGSPLRLPEIALPPPGRPSAAESVAVRLDASDRCERYTARVIRGVAIGPSPDWLRVALEAVGLRSINNVVDVTNYVMLETGQPLHAFDLHLLAVPPGGGRPTIIVRGAAAGEKFVTLDNREHTLEPGHLLIADEQKGIALAGVMGGRDTEIKNDTRDVLLESAWFLPPNIRRTSKSLGLRTDASYRFERGADPDICDRASQRAAQLILATAGGTLAEGVVDVCARPIAQKEITLRHHRVNDLLGLQLRPEEIEAYLGQLGLQALPRNPRAGDDSAPPEPVRFQIPTFRVDLKQEVDLIEEVARMHGVDKIPSTPPRGGGGSHPFDAVFDQFAEARRLLTGLGLNEAQGQTLISAGAASAASSRVVGLANPLSADMDALRPSLLPGLLATLRHNANRQVNDLAVFEIGRVFQAGGDRIVEGWRVAVALTGARQPGFWAGADRGARCDIHDLKGILEEFTEQLGLRGLTWTRRAEPTPLFIESAVIQLAGKLELGQLGQVAPAVAREHDLREPVFLAELDLSAVLARRNPVRSFKALPSFPATRRDLAMIVPDATTHDAVLAVVRQTKPTLLEAVELFDVFRGQNVPAGQKSVAYAFTYRSADRTLTDNEVNAAQQKIIEAFRSQLGATIRE